MTPPLISLIATQSRVREEMRARRARHNGNAATSHGK